MNRPHCGGELELTIPNREFVVEPDLLAIDRSKLTRCPECWTNGHEHRKTCRYAGTGMAHHIRPR